VTNPPFYPVVAQFDGVAVETEAGTPVAMSATVPLTAPLGWQDKPLYITDKGMRGSMTDEYGEVQGVMICDVGGMQGNVLVDTFGYLLANILGDVAETGTTAPYQHEFALMNPASGNSYTAQPVTNTWTHYDGVTPSVGARQIPGLCLSQLEISWEYATKLLTWTAKGTGWESVAAGSRPSPSPSSVKPDASWIGQFAVGGTVMSDSVTNLETAKITINRELEVEYTGNGSQNPLGIARAGLTVETAYTFIAQDLTYYTDVMSNTQPQIQAIFSTGTGASLQSLQIDMQQNALVVPKPNAGKKMARWDITGKGIANTTNAGATGGDSPLMVTLKNAVASGIYT
jgi:hypothetical protein